MKLTKGKVVVGVVFVMLLVLLFAFVLFGCEVPDRAGGGWLVRTRNVLIQPVEKEDGEATPTAPEFSDCNELCSSQGYGFAYSYDSGCRGGEYKVTYGYPDEDPLLICCCSDVEREEPVGDDDDDDEPSPEPPASPYSYSECDLLRDEHGKDFSAVVVDQSACEDYGFVVCDNHGTYMANYDWFEPNCCLVNCAGVDTPLYGTYTFPECYDMAMDYTHPDGTSYPLDNADISMDGGTWGEADCHAEAMADCDDMVVVTFVRDNCCMWKCYIP